jgi:hypothetical protein
MSIINMSSRKICEWCTNTRHLLEYVAREMNYHSSSLANIQLDYYCRKTCNSTHVHDLYILLMELLTETRTRTLQDFNSVDPKYILILNEVLVSYREGYPPPYKKYIN